MWPDRVSNPGPLTYESGALQTALLTKSDKTFVPNYEGNVIQLCRFVVPNRPTFEYSYFIKLYGVDIHASLRIRLLLHKL